MSMICALCLRRFRALHELFGLLVCGGCYERERDGSTTRVLVAR